MADQTNNQMGNATPTNGGGKNMTLLYVTIAVIILLALGAAYFLMNGGGADSLGNGTDTEEQTQQGGTGPVAIVNGEEVPRAEYNARMTQFENVISQQGVQIAPEQIQQQTVNSLINNTLLLQAAADAGVSVSDGDVQTEYAAMVERAGGNSAFQTQLQQMGYTEEQLRSQLREELIINAYVETVTDTESITVTDADVTAFYDELAAGNENIPALEEVRPQIEQQLRLQQQQQQVAEIIQQLRAESEIEILI